jgi:competence protein ComEC
MLVTDCTSIIQHLIPEPHAGLLSGIAFGTKETIDPVLKADLIRTGTIHIVALSGFNISVIVSMVGGLLVPVVGRKWGSGLSLVGIWWFIWFVGSSPSVVRAGLMGSLQLLSVVFGRQYWAIFSLALTGIILLMLNPSNFADVGFQLSFAATLGIILFGKNIQTTQVKNTTPNKNKNGVPPNLQSTLPLQHEWPMISQYKSIKIHIFYIIHTIWIGVSSDFKTILSAQVFTVPLLLYHFGSVSFISPLTNMLIGWAIPYTTIIGLIVGFGGLISMTLIRPVAWISWMLLTYIKMCVELTARVPFSSFGGV